MHRLWTGALIAIAIASSVVAGAQIGGKPVSGGNPTPGTPQPDAPNLSDRITVSGCLRPAPNQSAAGDVQDANTPSDSRFVLANAKRVDRLPPDTGGSALAAKANGSSYRLEGLDSQFSPFVNVMVEVSGEVKPLAVDKPSLGAPTLLVEFIQKINTHC